MFSGVEVENRHFRPLYCDCSPLAEERPAISIVIYASLKSTFTGLQLLPLKSAKFRENSNFSSSRSSKVIDLGANRKRICSFLLVINSNFGRISFRFRDTPPSFDAPVRGNPFEFMDETYRAETRGMGLLYTENCKILTSVVFA